MNANKTTLAVAIALASLFSAPLAHAEDAVKAAPALYGVQEFQVQHGRIVNPTASGNCGTSSGEIASMVLAALKTAGIPAFSVLGAPAAKNGVARIDIYPDVATLQPMDKQCVSWLSLSAQTKDVLRVFPVETPRNLTTTYWSGGLMVISPAAAHSTSLSDAVQKLAAAFARQYKLDQPPNLIPQDPSKSLLLKPE